MKPLDLTPSGEDDPAKVWTLPALADRTAPGPASMGELWDLTLLEGGTPSRAQVERVAVNEAVGRLLSCMRSRPVLLPTSFAEASRTLVERAHTRTVAQNIASAYGVERLAELVDDLTSGKPVPEIAARFGVSRQRVYQWRTSLGFETRAWTPRPEILRLVDE